MSWRKFFSFFLPRTRLPISFLLGHNQFAPGQSFLFSASSLLLCDRSSCTVFSPLLIHSQVPDPSFSPRTVSRHFAQLSLGPLQNATPLQLFPFFSFSSSGRCNIVSWNIERSVPLLGSFSLSPILSLPIPPSPNLSPFCRLRLCFEGLATILS